MIISLPRFFREKPPIRSDSRQNERKLCCAKVRVTNVTITMEISQLYEYKATYTRTQGREVKTSKLIERMADDDPHVTQKGMEECHNNTTQSTQWQQQLEEVAAERDESRGREEKKSRTEEHHDDAKADDALTTNPPGCSRQPNTWERTPILPFRSILPYCTDTLRYAKTHPPPARSSTTVLPSSTHTHTYKHSGLHPGLY